MKKVNAVSVHTMILNGKAAKSAREHIIVCSRRSVCETERNNERRDSHGGVKKTGEVWVEWHCATRPRLPLFFNFPFLLRHLPSCFVLLTECLELAKDIRAHAESSKTT